MRWFRLYSDILDDPKISKLSDAEFRHMVLLMAHACELEKNGDLGPDLAVISWRIRVPEKDLSETMAVLQSLNIIKKNSGFSFINWEKRQFTAEQKQQNRHRDKREAAGLPRNRWINPHIRAAVLMRDGNKCVTCGATDNLTIDHIVPEMHGGTNTEENLQVLCRACNAKKRDFPNELFNSPINNTQGTHKAPASTDTESESDTEKGLKASAAKTEPVEESPQPSKPEKTYPQEVHTLCKTLADLIAARDPKFKVKGLNGWLSEMDRLIRLDGRTPEEIEKVMRWAQADGFWHRNILSVDKLREQFPRLLMEMQAAGKPGNGKNATRYEKNMAAIRSVLDECEAQKGANNGNPGNLLEIAGDDGNHPAGQNDQPGVHEDLPGDNQGHPRRSVF